MKKIFTIIAVFFLFAQNDVKSHNYIFKHLGIENGLTNNYVRDIAQDKHGFIWIATELGLNRFDGSNFTTYKSYHSKLSNNALNALFYDKQSNTLWIGGKFNSLDGLDCNSNKFTNYKSNNKNTSVDNIVDILNSADGGLWIVPHGSEIVHFNKKRKKFTALSNMGITKLDYYNWCAFDDNKGNLYIGHSIGGMSIVNLKDKSVNTLINDPKDPQSLPGNSVYTIYKDKLENIWVGTNQGLGLFNPTTEEFTVFRHEPNNPNSLISDHIYDIKETEDHKLWICSDIGGISILDLYSITLKSPQNIMFRNMTSGNNNTISSNNIRNILQDSFGNIWIGNYGYGLDFISHTKPPFQTIEYFAEKGDIIKYKPVLAICKDNKGEIWLGGENEIVLVKDNKPYKTFNITKKLTRPYGQIFSMISIEDENLLLGIYDDGLLKFNSRSGTIERINLSIKNVDIITFYKEKCGKVWIGSEYGLFSYYKGTIKKEEYINKQIKDSSIYGILRDKEGKLWVGTYGGGISIFNKNNRLIKILNTDNHFFSNSINSLYIDSNKRIWIASRNGVGLIKDSSNPNKYEVYDYRHGLEDLFIRAIYEDNNKNIWISTNNSISYLDKKSNTFYNYNYRDGIPSGNFIEGSVCKSADGTLYFGSLSGACYFNPNNIIIKRPAAIVQIVECKKIKDKIENKNLEEIIPIDSKQIELPYNQNSFMIKFSVTDFSQNQQVEYAYMMKGLSNQWTNTMDENQVTFRDLSPGDYTFMVNARVKNQSWDQDNITKVSIHIYPPIWETWYAKLFYIIILITCIFIFMKYYNHRLLLKNSLEFERKKNLDEQELNNERLQFYTNITHELRTPLTLILGPLEDLSNDENLPQEYSKKINIIHKSAIGLLNLINKILEFRKMETQNRQLVVSKGNLSELITEIGLRFKEFNRNNNITFKIDIKDQDAVLFFDSEIINSILNNLLSNAMKYTIKGNISLILSSVIINDEKFAEIKVCDTGFGIEADALPHIFDRYYQANSKHQASGTGIGLALVKSLATLHQGTLNVESKVGKGTTFSFMLNYAYNYPNALHKEWEKTVIEISNVETETSNDESNCQPILLIVEDNNDISDYIASYFSETYHIITANNGKEGYELAINNIPDIIVSDIMMPVMNGIELCKRVKKNIQTSHIPVILLTAKDTNQDKEDGYDSGADSYLTKPFSAKLLKSRISNLLDSRRNIARLIAEHAKEFKSDNSEDTFQIKINKLDEMFLEKFTAIVEENLDSVKLDINFITKEMGMSHSTLYRKIKSLSGVSVNEFIRKIRLKNSIRLLIEKGMNISEAAYSTGFNDLGYFRNCFKEEYGMTPSEYLKKKF